MENVPNYHWILHLTEMVSINLHAIHFLCHEQHCILFGIMYVCQAILLRIGSPGQLTC